MTRGYFAIGVYYPKIEYNIGTLFRSALNFGAKYIFTIGRRYKTQCTDTSKTPLQIPLFNYKTIEEFLQNRPFNCPLVGIEQSPKSREINNFCHPPQCIYLLGAEDGGLPTRVQEICQHVIHINTPYCLNVATAGSIVMFHRSLI